MGHALLVGIGLHDQDDGNECPCGGEGAHERLRDAPLRGRTPCLGQADWVLKEAQASVLEPFAGESG